MYWLVKFIARPQAYGDNIEIADIKWIFHRNYIKRFSITPSNTHEYTIDIYGNRVLGFILKNNKWECARILRTLCADDTMYYINFCNFTIEWYTPHNRFLNRKGFYHNIRTIKRITCKSGMIIGFDDNNRTLTLNYQYEV